MENPPDFVAVPGADGVEAWSVRRLPFEPKGSMLEFRSALRAALSALDTRIGRLRCAYSSASTDFCDAENVLLYNVGMSSFGRLTEHSVTFERSHLVPTCPEPLSGPALHHLRYTTQSDTTFLHWQIGAEIAAVETATPRRVDKAADWWWATRTGTRTMTGVDLTNQPYGLRIQIGGLDRSTASVLKPMLDGIVASLHRDDSPADETVTRLATQLREAADDVRAQLMAPDAPLGQRLLVRPFRDGLQWNPADDLCVACSVENRGPAYPGVVRGQLLCVAPISSP
ncbi:MAG TPA: hypothetical protein VM143_14405 [Acidimicrobiales bacterium]|nr:hypothetical protein [Acidimicrobiales bacterium]